MGHISKDLQNIPDGYLNYLIILPSPLENEAQSIIDSEFIRLAKAVGEKTLLVYLYGGEENQIIIDELQLHGNKFPMLFYLDKRPDAIESFTSRDECISFQLGSFPDKYSLLLFLEKICWYVKSSHVRESIEWNKKKEMLAKILRPVAKGLPYVSGIFESILNDM